MIINTKFMTRNDCYTAGRLITPRGIMIHSTATPGVMAAQWFARWNKSFKAGEIDRQVCVHAFVDDKEVWQYLPWNYRGWHCGGDANNTHIGVEICEPGGFRYSGTKIVGYDLRKNDAYFRAAWDNAVGLCTELCREFGLNETNIIDHSEGHKRGIASNHGDASHWFKLHRESIDTFRAAVKKALAGTVPDISDKKDDDMTQDKFNDMFAAAMTAYQSGLSKQPPSAWAKKAWDDICAEGLLDGTAPRSALTREQAAMVLSRLRK